MSLLSDLGGECIKRYSSRLKFSEGPKIVSDACLDCCRSDNALAKSSACAISRVPEKARRPLSLKVSGIAERSTLGKYLRMSWRSD